MNMNNWYKIAKKSINDKDMANLHSLVKKIMKGKRNWTPEELQLQLNYSDAIEEILMEKYKELT